MYPFEVFDERTQRVEFYFNRFEEYRRELFRQYPVTPAHSRLEFNLIFPSDRLQDVYVHDWNPHHEIGNYHLSVYDCFYNSNNWSTIFETYSTHSPSQPEGIKVFAEEGHQNPWGEPIRLMSTSEDIYDDSSHRFAYFRGKYWKLLTFIPYHRHRSIYDIMRDYPQVYRGRRGFTGNRTRFENLRPGDIIWEWHIPAGPQSLSSRWGNVENIDEIDWLHEGF